ncbi:MAG: hypothetical protein AUI83_01535 [Armatimonadetes bacterium 13_1_40CM_3_65_7]|nr:MAG: hypothetical protein AUI83_01535 [Armatimonadetes bacterium 13_1_40CM_3_65_7]
MQVHDLRQAGVQPDLIVDPQDARLRDGQGGPRAIIRILGVRDHGIQAVVAPAELDNYEDAIVWDARPAGELGHVPWVIHRQRRAGDE